MLHVFITLLYSSRLRRDGRAVECTGLENQHGFVAHLGFESLSLRHLCRYKYASSQVNNVPINRPINKYSLYIACLFNIQLHKNTFGWKLSQPSR